ncbi:MAG: PASTA domain-containing protein [Planctomycetota bacterium]
MYRADGAVAVPDVVGLAQATAESSIVAAGLVVGTVSTNYSPTVPSGDVISQTPTGGAQVSSGSSVDIEVSLGPDAVSVPNVVGLAQATAESSIVAAGLVVGTVSTNYSPTVQLAAHRLPPVHPLISKFRLDQPRYPYRTL